MNRCIQAILVGLLLWGAGSVSAAVAEPKALSPSAVLLHPSRLYDASEVLRRAESKPGLLPAGSAQDARRKRAMLYSLILPGLGEYSLGHKGRAKVFFAAEGAIWTLFGVFRIEGSHRRDLYREFAWVHAGVPERGDDDFYRIIGNYDSSEGPFSANEDVRRRARALFPNDPEAQRKYFEEHAYVGDDAWSWESGDLRERYRDLRTDREEIVRRPVAGGCFQA